MDVVDTGSGQAAAAAAAAVPPSLAWATALSDGVLALAYFAIAAAVVVFVRRRGEPALKAAAWLFSLFIVTGGVSHLLGMAAPFAPLHGALASSKVAAAAAAAAVAVALWVLMPKALALPTLAQLRGTIARLAAEVQQRRSAEEHLVDLQQSLAATLASIEAGFVATDRQGLVTRLNDVAERVLGWSQAEALGRSYWEVFVREGRPESHLQTNAVDLMIADGLTVRDRQLLTVVARDGRRTPLRVNAALTHSADGSVRGMVTVFRDLTGQMAAEAQSQQAQERFRRVVEAAPNGMLLVDRAGRIAMANRKAEELFGYGGGRLAGQPVETLVPAAARADHARWMDGVFDERQPRAMGAGRDLHGLRRDGTEVPLEIGLSPLDMPDGRYTLASVIDITERKQRDDELRRSNADLEQFAYIASHDLQEPLRMVASYTELLEQRYKGRLDERADKYIFYAVDGAKRMQRLVADLLAYSRVGSQGKPLVPVDAAVVLQDVLRVLAPRVHASGAQVRAGALPAVLADEGQLHQLLLNLVGNALKFRAERAPVVSIDAVLDRDTWVFSVADNGIGIEPQYADRIFQMFQRLHERGKYDGSGIGLAIAKRILERHGGRIWLDSVPGEGTTFRFTLRAVPAATPAPDDPGPPAAVG